MGTIATPTKPFPEYKWRWADYTPIEGLNQPPRFLGVLRVLGDHEGEKVRSPAVLKDLKIAEDAMSQQVPGRAVHLVRKAGRDVLRGAARYWKALGLLASTQPITLTVFGKQVAASDITQSEFAIATVKTLTLPNKYLEGDAVINTWQQANLQIKPLELLLEILTDLYDTYGEQDAHITPFELYKVVIPLAGDKRPLKEHSKAIHEHRQNLLDISHWPDCTPKANDKRLAREFLLFLAYYGFCELINPKVENAQQRFALRSATLREAKAIAILPTPPSVEAVVQDVRSSQVFSDIERDRVLIEALSRPQQAKFRREVLQSATSTCLLTGETLPQVLQASHIIPVKYRGTDDIANGLCFRADIHILFDTGHIRIRPDGTVFLTDVVKRSKLYAALPSKVQIPAYVSPRALQWRWDYFIDR